MTPMKSDENTTFIVEAYLRKNNRLKTIPLTRWSLKDYKPQAKWKSKLHEVIYEADTPSGKLFDILLFVLIIISVILVMLESIDDFDARYHRTLLTLEWVVTIFFTIEYIARLISIKKPLKYVFSFYGIIDFLSTIPLYLSYILEYLMSKL